MDTTTVKDWSDLCYDVEQRVREYVPGPWRWTAKQDVDYCDDLYGICIGQGVCFVRLSEVPGITDTRIRELATEILGYAPDSPQDISRRYNEARDRRVDAQMQIMKLQKDAQYWQEIEDQLAKRLSPANASE